MSRKPRLVWVRLPAQTRIEFLHFDSSSLLLALSLVRSNMNDEDVTSDLAPSLKRSSEESPTSAKKEQESTRPKEWKLDQFDIVLLKEELLGEAKKPDEAECTERCDDVGLKDNEAKKGASKEDSPKDIEGIIKKIKDRTSSSLTIGAETFKSGLNQVVLFACFNGCAEVVRYFIDNHSKHFDINAPIKCIRETKDSMERRLARLSIVSRVYCPDLVLSEKQQLHSTTLLHGAVMHHHLEIVEMLLSAGAIVDSTDCCGDTPLLKAVETHPEDAPLISALIKHGANPNYRGMSTLTPLMMAAKSTSEDTSELVPLLLDAGADPNMTDGRGYSALHTASSWANERVIKALFDHGVDPQFPVSGVHSSIPSPLCVADQMFGFKGIIQHLNRDIPDFVNCQKNSKELFTYAKSAEANCKPHMSITTMFVAKPECPPSCKTTARLVEATLYAMSQQPMMEPERQACEYASMLKDVDDFTFSSSLIQAYLTRNDPLINSLSDLVKVSSRDGGLIQKRWNPTLAGLCQVIVAEHMLGFGHEVVIQLLLRVLAVALGNASSIEERSFYLLHRASQMLLYLVNEFDGKIVALGQIVYILMLELFAVIINVLAETNNQIIGAAPKVFRAIIENVTECFCRYVEFTNSTHSHLFPNWDNRYIARCLLHCLCCWLAVGNQQQCEPVLEKLVEKCLVIAVPGAKNTTLLHVIINMWPEGKKRNKLMELLLDAGGHSVINTLDSDGCRPIHLAAIRSTKLVDSLLEYGAHPDATDGYGNSVKRYYSNTSHPMLRTLFDSPLPLACISARSILAHGIPYLTLDYPSRLKTLITWHSYQPTIEEKDDKNDKSQGYKFVISNQL